MKKQFKGDIIITDPCYIDNSKNELWENPKVDIFSGDGIEQLGFTNYIWESTLYGDWSCTTFQLKEKSKNKSIEEISEKDLEENVLGHFCADAGLVAVFLLEEVLKFNPDFDYHLNNLHTTTLIKDFEGYVEYIVFNDEAFLRGVGNVNFLTRQTGC